MRKKSTTDRIIFDFGQLFCLKWENQLNQFRKLTRHTNIVHTFSDGKMCLQKFNWYNTQPSALPFIRSLCNGNGGINFIYDCWQVNDICLMITVGHEIIQWAKQKVCVCACVYPFNSSRSEYFSAVVATVFGSLLFLRHNVWQPIEKCVRVCYICDQRNTKDVNWNIGLSCCVLIRCMHHRSAFSISFTCERQWQITPCRRCSQFARQPKLFAFEFKVAERDTIVYVRCMRLCANALNVCQPN